jgi:hypothetical protein
MRGRQRHLNPRDAGASLALDSRFIVGISDGAAITAVSDRAGNTATVTSGSGVTYETGSINGEPAIQFAPAGGFKFRAPVSVTSNALTILAVSAKTENAAGVDDDFSRAWGLSNGGGDDYNNTNGVTAYYTGAPSLNVYRNSADIASRSIAYAVPHISAFRLSGTSVTWSLNGSATAGTTSATALNADEIGIGGQLSSATNSRLNGFIAQVILIPLAVADALRKRLEHAAALSFKIPCN